MSQQVTREKKKKQRNKNKKKKEKKPLIKTLFNFWLPNYPINLNKKYALRISESFLQITQHYSRASVRAYAHSCIEVH